MSFTSNTLAPQAQSNEIGVVFPKGHVIVAADFDKNLGEIFSALFKQNELWGAFMVTDSVIQIYTVSITLKSGIDVTIPTPPWTWIPLQGLKVVAAGTTATSILILAGQ